MDTNLRTLQRNNQNSPLDHYKWRLAMIRAGQDLKPEVGDLIEVGQWRGHLEWLEDAHLPSIFLGIREPSSIIMVQTTKARIKVIEPVRPE